MTIAQIEQAVCSEFGVSAESLHSRSRCLEVIVARHLVMYLSRQLLGMSYKTIGEQIGGLNRGLNHSTVLSGIRATVRRMNQDERLRIRVESIRTQLTCRGRLIHERLQDAYDAGYRKGVEDTMRIFREIQEHAKPHEGVLDESAL